MSLRVFMLGWEFPPFITGGLGTACYGLTKGLNRLGVQTLFVLPRPVGYHAGAHVQVVSPANLPAPSVEPGSQHPGHAQPGPPADNAPPSSGHPEAQGSPFALRGEPRRRMGGLAYDYEIEAFEHVRFIALEAGVGTSPYDRPGPYTKVVTETHQNFKTVAPPVETPSGPAPESPPYRVPTQPDAPAPGKPGTDDSSGDANNSSGGASESSGPHEPQVERGEPKSASPTDASNCSPTPSAESRSTATSANSSPEYQGNLFDQTEAYARLATYVAEHEQFDVIHAHDWLTYRAGVAVSALSGKPLVIHVHSTEIDRSGNHYNQRIFDIERQALLFAHRIIAVSHLTKNLLVTRYQIPADKIEVVYNAMDFNGSMSIPRPRPVLRDEKLVLFLGRITMQKGPEYFLQAAKKVLGVMDNVRFIMAGWGDRIRDTIRLAADMGIGHKVLFTGFLRGGDVERAFRMADLFVMPSVSEPFGITPLEAIHNNVPVLISKQSGVSEVVQHALKVDFWDVDEMANKIVAVLRHPPLRRTLREHARLDVRRLSWDEAAGQCAEVYDEAIALTHYV